MLRPQLSERVSSLASRSLFVKYRISNFLIFRGGGKGFEIACNRNASCFIMFYTAIPIPKTGKFSEAVILGKSIP